jgi:hypothetical protein
MSMSVRGKKVTQEPTICHWFLDRGVYRCHSTAKAQSFSVTAFSIEHLNPTILRQKREVT